MITCKVPCYKLADQNKQSYTSLIALTQSPPHTCTHAHVHTCTCIHYAYIYMCYYSNHTFNLTHATFQSCCILQVPPHCTTLGFNLSYNLLNLTTCMYSLYTKSASALNKLCTAVNHAQRQSICIKKTVCHKQTLGNNKCVHHQ